MKRIVLALLFILVAHAHAEDTKQMKKLITEVKAVAIQGQKLHRTYTLTDEETLRACTAKARPYRDKAKKLKERIEDLDRTELQAAVKYQLFPAAQAAFQCVYCSPTAAAACNDALTGVKSAEQALREWSGPQQKSSATDKW